MNQDKYVFAQLVEFLNNDKFRRLVDKYDGNRYVKHFTCWSQLLAMMFGQLSNRESLRDLIVALEAHQGKRYHLGLGREHVKNDRLTSWIFQEGSMRLIPLRFLYVWLYSLGRSSVRKKVELRLMSFMT